MFDKKTSLLYFFILPVFCAFAQFSKFELKQISQEHDLPGVTVRHLFQDSRGLMWIGVESYGLCKYDGYNFELFTHAPEDSSTVSNNVVESLCEDSDGNIWAGTQNGLNIYDRNTKRFRKIFKGNAPQSIPGNVILDLKKMSNGDIWLATDNGAARYSHHTKTFSPYLTHEDKKITVYDIELEPDGNIWLSSSYGVYHMQPSGNILAHYTGESRNSELPYNECFSLEIASDSSIIIASSSILMRYNSQSKTWSKLYDCKSDITDIVEDKRGYFWISTATNGLVLLSPDYSSFQHYVPNNENQKGLKSNAIRDILIDKDSLIWLGLKFEGVQFFNYQSHVFEHIKKERFDSHSLSNNNIISIYEDRDKQILIGTGEGLNSYNPQTKKITHLLSTVFPQLNTLRINAFAQNQRGDLWIGSANCLFLTNKTLNPIQKILEKEIIDIIVDKNDVTWIGSREGLYVYKNGQLKSFEEYSGKLEITKNYAIKTLYADSKGNIWIGTLQNGLFLYEPHTNLLHYYSATCAGNNCIGGDLIRFIHEDADGDIWISTRGQGLSRFSYKDKTFKTFTERDGLPTNTLFGILEDNNKNLWISSYQGLCKFNYKTFKTENYTKEYGLQNDIFEPNASCLASDGTMYFGGNNGFNAFRPGEIRVRKNPAPLVVTSMKVYDRDLLIDVDSPVSVNLDYDENYITFDFALLDYTSNIGKRYSYMLHGFDKDWIHTKNRHFASYTNLEPGHYIFKVKAETKDGVSNKNTIEIAIFIDAPLWQKRWFQIVLTLFIAGMVAMLFQYRLRQEKKRSKHLAFMVDEKTAHLKEQQKVLISQKQQLEDKSTQLEESNEELKKANVTKNTLVSIIAHDLKNQFQSIVSVASLMQSESAAQKTASLPKHTKLIHTAAKSVSSVLENLLNWYKTQNSELKPLYETIDLLQLVLRIVNNYALTSIEKNIEIQIKIPEATIVIADREMLKAIIRNLLNNALKFTPPNGTIIIEANIVDDLVSVSVKDTGKGMNENELETLFFFNTERRSSGLGLQICKEFSDVMNGNLQVYSHEGEGTVFSFTVKRTSSNINSQIPDNSIALPEEFMHDSDIAPGNITLLKDKKILVIDDNEAVLNHLESILSPYTNIAKASEGAEGLKLAHELLPDLIVTDLVMPGLNGIELTKELRAHEKTAYIPIILLTAQNFNSIVETAYNAGINDFIPKPFDEKLFLLKIKSIFTMKAAIAYTAEVSSAIEKDNRYLEKSFMKEVVSYINEQMDLTDFTVETLAENMNMSKSTLIRHLKKETNKAPSEIINDIKFEKAKRMLSSNQYTIAEIAWMVGFTEVKYFSRKFREQFGMSPKEFRSKMRLG